MVRAGGLTAMLQRSRLKGSITYIVTSTIRLTKKRAPYRVAIEVESLPQKSYPTDLRYTYEAHSAFVNTLHADVCVGI